ncbi:MAG TPA: caspase family protein [Blastocatellia bacterium]|nr:caspase family protein [Blastocatellia bacterium]
MFTRIRRHFFLLVIALPVFALTAQAEDRALIVGVEKYKDPLVPPTPGCVADALAMSDFIKAKFGFPSTGIRLLLNEEATAANIENNLQQWLVAGSRPGDRIFFFYAGHGSQLPDDDHDEADGFDETLAPYDVDPLTGAREIRDDFFSQIIARLSGRRAVLIFDSCHSGTIARGAPASDGSTVGGGARYLPRPDQFKALTHPAPGARGIAVDDYQVTSRPPGTRGIKLGGDYVDSDQLGALSGIVIISAANENQSAYPLKVNGALRGALSFLVTDLQKETLLTVDELKARLLRQVSLLHQSKELRGDQQPQFEVISSVPLGNKPLFATWEQAPAVALVNPLSSIRVSISTGEGKTLYREGENISYQITTDTAGYLYLLVFSESDIATCIFPNANDADNRISAGTIILPRGGRYAFPVGEPFGRDVAVALISRERLNLGEKENYKWSEVFDRLKLKSLQETLGQSMTRRGVNIVKDAEPALTGWQGAVITVESKKK